MSIINDFKNEFRFSAHGRTSRRNFWIYQIGLFVLGLAVAMVCGTIIGLTNAVVGFWLIILKAEKYTLTHFPAFKG